ncbi:MAG: hypothetical protein ACTSXO_10535 [Candidatus Heimdallarchaeota archaeon]|nr:MAG: hypothetical protein DRP02_04410 [Candidatus Gerdarchaeota archaeon]RLI74054.1 MAG: hypothetical protein DRO91_01515 [Candidatus Heimdallarchaeota archaeon]
MAKFRSKKPKTLWTQLPNYEPINNIIELPLYDESHVSEEHRILSQIIRENWELIHPLARDYILSSAAEWRSLFSEYTLLENNLKLVQQSLDSIKEEYDKKLQAMLVEKEAAFEKAKEQIAESFRETIEKKDQELMQYKMLTESMSTSEGTEKRITELENLVQELRDRCKSQEIEAMNIQKGISQNFERQISAISEELFEKNEQIEKLRNVLSKAKEQLILLKQQNDELKSKYSELLSNNRSLEKMIKEREEKLRKIVKSIERLE